MFDDEDITYEVVANHEEQYSIWPEFKEIPDGWIAVGPQGKKEDCLDYIEKIWTDMRPKSLRDKMRERDDVDEEVPDVDDDLEEKIDDILATYDDELDEYSNGRPELYGWFFARIFEDLEDEIDPDVIRAGLNKVLPPHEIPEEYA